MRGLGTKKEGSYQQAIKHKFKTLAAKILQVRLLPVLYVAVFLDVKSNDVVPFQQLSFVTLDCDQLVSRFAILEPLENIRNCAGVNFCNFNFAIIPKQKHILP